jgi:cytochrome P450 family 4
VSFQEKVYEEIDSVFGQSRRDISCEDLPRLVYLERVVKETLRLFPVAACLGRLLDKDIVTSKSGGNMIFDKEIVTSKSGRNIG